MRKLIPIALLLGVLFSGCKERAEQPLVSASLTVQLEGSGTKSVGTPLGEDAIERMAVYVFSNNVLEKVQIFGAGTTQIVTGLTMGPKQVVILANLPASFVHLSAGAAYSSLALATNYIDLDDQQTATNGLVMTAEVATQLSSGANTISLVLTRLVAKVKLGTLTVAADANFVLQSVYVTKVHSKSSLNIPVSGGVTTTTPYYGGYAGMLVTPANRKTYLVETISLADFADRYFYVFAHRNATDPDATMLGIAGTYNGTPTYFPFRINDAINGDGTYLSPNTVHEFNVTINRPNSGSPSPEEPNDPATLSVTVTVTPWVVQPIRNVTW